MTIMIATHQHHFNVTVSRPEGSEIAIQRLGVARFGVHQIAQNDDATHRM